MIHINDGLKFKKSLCGLYLNHDGLASVNWALRDDADCIDCVREKNHLLKGAAIPWQITAKARKLGDVEVRKWIIRECANLDTPAGGYFYDGKLKDAQRTAIKGKLYLRSILKISEAFTGEVYCTSTDNRTWW